MTTENDFYIIDYQSTTPFFATQAVVSTSLLSEYNSTNNSMNSTGLNTTTSTTTFTDANPLGIPFYTILISANLYVIIFLAGCIGNCIVIFVVWRNKFLQHNTNYCLVNLSIADLLLIIVCMPSACIELFSEEVWYFGYVLCKTTQWLENTVVNGSVLTITSICIERYLAISKPLVVKKFTQKRLTIVIILIWTISIIAALPYMIVTSYEKGLHSKYNTYEYVCYTQLTKTWQRVYLYVCLIGFCIVPCVLLVCLYSCIICIIQNLNYTQYYSSLGSKKSIDRSGAGSGVVSKRTKRTSNNNNNNNVNGDFDDDDYDDDFNNGTKKTATKDTCIESVPLQLNSDPPPPPPYPYPQHKLSSSSTSFSIQKSQSVAMSKNSLFQFKKANKHHRQTTKMLFVMMVLFFICILPLRVFTIWCVYATKEDLHRLGIENFHNILTLTRLLFYMNSSINPILYHILSTKFQTAFKRTFTFYCHFCVQKRQQKRNVNTKRVRFYRT